jgi:RNA polymerase sigma factor (sigma-70 family)
MAANEWDEGRRRYEELVAAWRGRWVRAARRILRDAAEAEDLVQDTLVAVWRRWNAVSPDDPARYVSRAITLNALKRRQRRRQSVSLEDDARIASVERVEPDLDPLMLERLLAELPAPQQAVLRTRFYLGMTFDQVGRTLSISANTAASRCRYALATLRRRMKIGQ